MNTLVLTLLLGVALFVPAAAKEDDRLATIHLPEGFVIEAFAKVPNARQMAWGEKGTQWHRIRCRAGIKDVRLHDLRHSYASGGLLVGEGLTMIGKLLGHNKVETTARYAHLANDPMKAAANRIASRIADIAG